MFLIQILNILIITYILLHIIPFIMYIIYRLIMYTIVLPINCVKLWSLYDGWDLTVRQTI